VEEEPQEAKATALAELAVVVRNRRRELKKSLDWSSKDWVICVLTWHW
jgi:hypothetical protein